jgi:hypothetical protein
MRVTRYQLRTIICEAVNDLVLRDKAADEALRWFREGAVGQMTRDSWVTSVRRSPVEPEFDSDTVLRVTVGTSGNAKYQVDVVLDAYTGGFRGAGDVEKY